RRGACRAAIRIARGWAMPNDAIAMKHLDPVAGQSSSGHLSHIHFLIQIKVKQSGAPYVRMAMSARASRNGIEDVTRDAMDSLRSAPATTLIGTRQGVRK
ncbi:MAG: hypothetical protein ACJ8E5_24980, partial [Xanthobacteraceae bacterium]